MQMQGGGQIEIAHCPPCIIMVVRLYVCMSMMWAMVNMTAWIASYLFYCRGCGCVSGIVGMADLPHAPRPLIGV